MRSAEHSERWWQYVLISLATLIIVTLACDDSPVPPTDPILQPPTVNIGLKIEEDFGKWLGLFPDHIVPPPWIVKPPTTYYAEQDSFRVQGWAINSEDRSGGVPRTNPVVTLYEVDFPGYPTEVRELGWKQMESDNREWIIDDVPMESDRMVIAAKVSVVMPGGLRRYSDFSNRVTIYRGKPPAPSIELPEDGFETIEETVLVRGKGQAGYSIVLSRNSIEVGKSAADKDFGWEIGNVALDVGENKLIARVEGTDVQSEVITVKRVVSQPDFKFPWTAGEKHAWTGGPHAPHDRASWKPCDEVPLSVESVSGLDFDGGGWNVIAAAPGYAKKAKFEDLSGNVVIIDHGDGWETWYAHLHEISPEIGAIVEKPIRIERGTYLGISGCSGEGAKLNGICNPHLHLELRRHGKPETWDGKTVDGWTVHVATVKGQGGNVLNYYGTMTRGKNSTKEVEWCGSKKVEVVTGDEETRVATLSCMGEEAKSLNLSSECNRLISTNNIPAAPDIAEPTPTVPAPIPTQPLPPETGACSVDAIQSYLHNRGSPLADVANAFVSAGEQYNVDPRFVVAITNAESTLGTNGDCATRRHNAWGYGGGWPSCWNFDSWEQAIWQVTKDIGDNYFQTYGQMTIPSFVIQPDGTCTSHCWCAGGCGHWIRHVSDAYSALGGDPNTTDLSFAACSQTE